MLKYSKYTQQNETIRKTAIQTLVSFLCSIGEAIVPLAYGFLCKAYPLVFETLESQLGVSSYRLLVH